MTSIGSGSLIAVAKGLRNPLLVGQFLVALASLIQVVIFSALLTSNVYAIYVTVAGIWVIGSAFAGSLLSTLTYRALSTDGRLLTLSQGDVALVGLTVVIGAATAAWAQLPTLTIMWVAAGLLSLVFVEMRLAQILTLGHRWKFAGLTALRALMPPCVVAIASSVMRVPVDAPTVLAAVVFSNLVAASWRPFLRLQFRRGFSGFPAVGVANCALWVVASADRILLSGRVSPETLVAYGIAYGLADRAMRIPTTTLSSHLMPQALRSGHRMTLPRWPVAVAVISVCIALITWLATPLLTDCQYALAFQICAVIATALFCYGTALPKYIDILGTGRDTTVMAHSLIAAFLSVTLNILLIPDLGVMGAALASVGAYAYWLVALWYSDHTSH